MRSGSEFPPADEYFGGPISARAERMREIQNERFLRQMERAWQVPFYQRHWGAAGMQPGDIRTLEDLEKIPPFSVHDLRAGLEEKPFWADYIGIDPGTDEPMPLIVQTSGGTTGLPRPMIYRPRDREVMNIMTGRRLFMQGVRPFDLVQVVLSIGLDQRRCAGARRNLEIQRRGAGHDRLRRADADAPPDRAHPRMEVQVPGRLPGLHASTWRWWRATNWGSTRVASGIKGAHRASGRRGSRNPGGAMGRRRFRHLRLQRMRHDGDRMPAQAAECICSRMPSSLKSTTSRR